MRNRCWNALIKTIIVLIVVHILLLIAGVLWGTEIGWFGLAMIWPHWQATSRGIVAVILLFALYFGIYAWWTDHRED